MLSIMKIATILPYKENYTYSKAQAAAIWVSDFFKHSKYKKNNANTQVVKGKGNPYNRHNLRECKTKTETTLQAQGCFKFIGNSSTVLTRGTGLPSPVGPHTGPGAPDPGRRSQKSVSIAPPPKYSPNHLGATEVIIIVHNSGCPNKTFSKLKLNSL